MSRKLDAALDDCLNLLRTGASVADCLVRYPEYAEELRPLVSLASHVKAVPTPRPDPAAVLTNRQRMLDAVQRAAAPPVWSRLAPAAWLRRLSHGWQLGAPFRAAMALAVVVVLVSLTTGALFGSAADSLPGQAMYSVKRFGEEVRLSLTFNPTARQELQAEYLLERLHEVRQALDEGQKATYEFRAELEEIGNGYWIIGGLKIVLDNDTLVEGHVAVGAMVIVRASTDGDGTLRAIKLQVLTNPLLLTPAITSTPTPTITPAPSSTPTPPHTPAITSTPSATSTSMPTVTSTPSPLPTQTSTPQPTPTSTPTHTEEPEPTDDPDPTDIEEPESTDEPDPTGTEEPESTDEPDPTHTEEPDSTDEPDPTHTEEPEATDEPDPADDPYPTRSQEPDSTGERRPNVAEESVSRDPLDPYDTSEHELTNIADRIQAG